MVTFISTYSILKFTIADMRFHLNSCIFFNIYNIITICQISFRPTWRGFQMVSVSTFLCVKIVKITKRNIRKLTFFLPIRISGYFSFSAIFKTFNPILYIITGWFTNLNNTFFIGINPKSDFRHFRCFPFNRTNSIFRLGGYTFNNNLCSVISCVQWLRISLPIIIYFVFVIPVCIFRHFIGNFRLVSEPIRRVVYSRQMRFFVIDTINC